MWRHRATCRHCGQESDWQADREASEQEIFAHLKDRHGVAAPLIQDDYRLERQRQCEYCLEPAVDECQNCRQDFCSRHAGEHQGRCCACK